MEEDNENFNFDMINHAPNIHHNKISKHLPSKLKHPNAILRAKSLFKGTKLNRKKIKFKKDRINREPKEPPSEEGKIYDCKHPMCDKTFNDKNSYRKHLAIHGEKQYICQAENCGKKFLDNSKLRRHMLVHSGTKAYKCELCNKRFSLDFNLRTHLRIHTGEKPYICSVEGCYKRFSQSSNLSAHEKTHFLPKGEDEEEEEGGIRKKKYFRVIRAIPEPIKPKKPLVILDRDKYEKRLEDERKLKTKFNERGPNIVIIYRTGKNESGIQALMSNEIPLIQSTIDKICPGCEVIYLTVIKKAEIRLMLKSEKGDYSYSEEGLVLDSGITRPDSYEFYLQPTCETGIPIFYRAIHMSNWNTLSIEEIEDITYRMCYSYSNWAGAIKIPSCLKHAEKQLSSNTQTKANEISEDIKSVPYYI